MDPLMLFSCYILFIPGSVILFKGGFIREVELLAFSGSSDFVAAIFYSLICYLALVLSKVVADRYLLAKRSLHMQELHWPLVESNINFIKFVIVISNTIVALNIYYNLKLMTNGDLVKFLKSIGYYASYAAEFGASTIGYIFAYISIIFATYLLAKRKIYKVSYFITLIIFIISLVFQARVTLTITSILAVYIFYARIRNRPLKFILLKLTLIASVAILLFIARFLSEIYRVYPDTVISVSDIGLILTGIFSELVGSGNLPNIFIIDAIIELWPGKFDFFLGGSILSAFLNIIPNPIFSDFLADSTVSVFLYNEVYKNILGGSVPPTIFGEMYVNFGPAGAIIAFSVLGILFSLASLLYRSSNVVFVVSYIFLNFYFFMVLAKGEFARLTSLLPIVFFISVVGVLKIMKGQRL